MYCWYLRNTYLENNLASRAAHGVRRADRPRQIDIPSYLYGTREDHIVPWQGAYRARRSPSGKRRFVLGALGHIAGVINPPRRKAQPLDRQGRPLPAIAQAWLDDANRHAGSWWTPLVRLAGAVRRKQVAAPKKPGNASTSRSSRRPGRYVKEKA